MLEKIKLNWIIYAFFASTLLWTTQCVVEDAGSPTPTPSSSSCSFYTPVPKSQEYFFHFDKDTILKNGQLYPVDSTLIASIVSSFQDSFPDDVIIKECMCDRMVMFQTPPGVDPVTRRETAEGRLDPTGDENERIGYFSFNYPMTFKQNFGPGIRKEIDTFYRRPTDPDDKPVQIAIIDTGFKHDDDNFVNHLWANPSECRNEEDDDDNCVDDDINSISIRNSQSSILPTDSHGTAVAGVVLDTDGDGTVDFPEEVDFQLMNIKISEEDAMDLFDAVCGLEYALEKEASVINFSAGLYHHPDSLVSLRAVVRKLGARGVTLVAAVGNDSVDIDECPFCPACYAAETGMEHVLAIGASDQTNTGMADFSNYGERTVFLLAEGENIDVLSNDGSPLILSGTSVASPVVTNAVAIIKAYRPEITATELRECLSEGASNVSGANQQVQEGIFQREMALGCIPPAEEE